MKTFILTFISFFTLLSCSNNDDENTQQNNEIVGTWKLVKFEAGFGPTFNYDGEITWKFNTNNTIDVTIANGTQVYSSLPLSNTGNYTYNIPNSNVLNLSQTENWSYEISNSQLIINQNPSADGRRLTFNKVQ
ncbi:MAG: hypothetical protein ACOVNP_08125 [Flavobacterium sp.]